MLRTLSITAAFVLISAYVVWFCLMEAVFVVSTTQTGFWIISLAVTGLVPYVLGRLLRARALQLAALVFAGIVFASRLVVLSPAKPFARFYAALKPGMSVDEVRAQLARRFPAGGRFRVPVEHLSPAQLVFTLDPTDGRYDWECVAIRLEAGRVVSAEYLPD